MRIAFFGGSFDPPHLGHLAVARAAQLALHLDRVLFAPVGLQPFKPQGSSASFEDRAAMTQLAIQNEPAFELSLADTPDPANPHPNYTAETLSKLRLSHAPGIEWFLILGADAFLSLRNWHRAAEIPFLANLIVASRPPSGASRKSPRHHRNLSSLASLARCLPKGIHLEPAPLQPNQYRLSNPAGDEAHLTILPNLHYDISATDLRRQLRGHPTSHPPLPPLVLQYIQNRDLYRKP